MLAGPVVSAVFMRGAFSPTDAEMTARATAAYGLGVLGLTAARPLASAFFARQDAATPVKIAVFSLLAAQTMNAVFILILELGHVGLALSVGLSACLNSLVLLAVLIRRGWFVPRGGWGIFAFRVLAGIVVMSGVLLWLVPGADFWRDESEWVRAGAVLFWTCAGAGIYFAGAFVCGARISDFRARIG